MKDGKDRLAAWLLSICALASVATSQEIAEVRWGFDGTAVPQRINLLSVRVVNASNRAFRGDLVLRRQSLGSTTGAPLVRPCFLSPKSSRWVQFLPWIIDGADAWTLNMRGKRAKQPKLGAPATVYLDTGSLRPPKLGIPVFPAALFPSTVLATEGLATVYLDAVPQWAKVQRRAFLDWLHTGGEVHVLPRFGSHPKFAADLAILNATETTRVGRGTVYHDDPTRDGISEYRDTIPASPSVKLHESSVGPSHRTVLHSLKKEFEPRVSWSILYLLGLGFVILVGPVYRVASVRWLGWKTALGCLTAVIVATTFTFEQLGRRDADEQSMSRTITFVRTIDAKRAMQLQYAAVFVTGGVARQFVGSDEYGVFSTATQAESIRGAIANGARSAFRTEIPVYSWRTFLHASVVGEALARPEAMDLGENGEWSTVEFALDQFPKDRIRAALTVFGGNVWRMEIEDGMLRRSSDSPVTIKDWEQSWVLSAGGDQHYEQYTTAPVVMNHALTQAWPVIYAQLGIPWLGEGAQLLPDDHVSLFIITDEQRPLPIAGNSKQDSGLTVYRFDYDGEDK